MDIGVAQEPIADFDESTVRLRGRLNPTTSALTRVYEDAKANPKRMVFAEAEEEVALRAAIQFRDFGYGTPILVGRTEKVLEKLLELSVDDPGKLRDRQFGQLPQHRSDGGLSLYQRLQRRGYTERDVRRMVNQERNVFAALLLAIGDGDAMITGLTRTYQPDRARNCPCARPQTGRDPVRHSHDRRQEPHDLPGRHHDQ